MLSAGRHPAEGQQTRGSSRRPGARERGAERPGPQGEESIFGESGWGELSEHVTSLDNYIIGVLAGFMVSHQGIEHCPQPFYWTKRGCWVLCTRCLCSLPLLSARLRATQGSSTSSPNGCVCLVFEGTPIWLVLKGHQQQNPRTHPNGPQRANTSSHAELRQLCWALHCDFGSTQSPSRALGQEPSKTHGSNVGFAYDVRELPTILFVLQGGFNHGFKWCRICPPTVSTSIP